ncbi:MAG: cbb3-type cytochrome c oxidase subunit I [Chloroflexota bacterium]|nr:cbb3-type cytochrome c oxidase subunit I [Chloroflexota bacterium]
MMVTDASLRRQNASNSLTLAWVVAGIALLLVLGLAGLLMRAMQAGLLPATQWFYPLLTLHGTGMVSLALVLMLAATRYAFGEALALSVGLMRWIFGLVMLAVVLLLASTLVGRLGTGWTFLYPLPYYPLGAWSPWAFVAFVLAVTIVVVAFLVTSIEFLWRGVRKYGSLGRMYGLEELFGSPAGEDNKWPKSNPAIIALTVVSLTWIPGALAGAVLVVLELVQVASPASTFNVLLGKNLLYFAGHMIVNVDIYMGAALVYAILPAYANRPWKMSGPLVAGWLVTTVAVMLAFFHHLYMDFAQPDAVQVIGEIFSYVSAFPAIVVTIFGALMLVWRSGIRWSTAPRLLYTGLAGWAIGGAAAVIDSSIPVNAVMHNTTWVPAHFHTYMGLGVVLFFLGAMYHILPSIAGGRRLSERAGRWASWLILTGGYALMLTWYLGGVLSEPRRYAVQLAGTSWLSLVGTLAALVIGAGGVIIATDLVRILTRPAQPGTARQVDAAA